MKKRKTVIEQFITTTKKSRKKRNHWLALGHMGGRKPYRVTLVRPKPPMSEAEIAVRKAEGLPID